MEELKKLKEAVATADKEYRLAKGYTEANSPQEMEDRMYQMMSNVYRYVDAVAERLYDHTKMGKHLPECPSAEHMERALAALGWDGSYSVQKPVIWASTRGGVLEIEYTSNKKN